MSIVFYNIIRSAAIDQFNPKALSKDEKSRFVYTLNMFQMNIKILLSDYSKLNLKGG